jgi:hypothetical protein
LAAASNHQQACSIQFSKSFSTANWTGATTVCSSDTQHPWDLQLTKLHEILPLGKQEKR